MIAQGCRLSGYPGIAAAIIRSTLKGLCNAAKRSETPLGYRSSSSFPRVAARGNPGLSTKSLRDTMGNRKSAAFTL